MPKKQPPKKAPLDLVPVTGMAVAGWQDLHQLDWFQALNKPDQKSVQALADLAEAELSAFNGAVSARVAMVKFLRKAQLPPEIARATLRARGYRDERISEILRVVNGPDDLLQRLEQGAIGFKAALLEARGKTPKLAPEARWTKKLNLSLSALLRVASHEKWTSHVEIEGPWKVTIERVDTEENPRVKAGK